MRKALTAGGSVTSTDTYQRRPLEVAARGNQAEIAAILVQAGADVGHKDMTDRTPLGLAVESGATETAAVLIEAGADVFQAYGGKARRITVTDWKLIHAAAWGPHVEVAELLLAKGVKHDLHSAAGLGDVAALTELLDEGEDIEAERVDGRTALHWAARNGQTDAVKFLVGRGAVVDKMDVGDRTPLYQSASKGHVGASTFLIDNGAETTLFDAAAVGHLSKLEELIAAGVSKLEGGAEGGDDGKRVDPSDGETYTKDEFQELYDGLDEWEAADPEKGAAEKGVKEVVNQRNAKGETVLFPAVTFGQVKVAELLIAKGINVNAMESHRDTALMMTANVPDSLDIAKLLIENGAQGVISFCRRINHAKGRQAMADLVALYFSRPAESKDSEKSRRKELDGCLKARAGDYFKLEPDPTDDPVGDALKAAKVQLAAKDEV